MSHQSMLSPAAVSVPAPSTPAAPVRKYARIPALDFTKGALVLTMVLYHWWNYFISPQGDVYRYLRFLTPSFIFIAGLLVSHVYLAGYGAANPKVPRRLLERGLKILAVFVALNAARLYLIPDARSGLMPTAPLDRAAAIAVFVTGNVAVAGSKIAAFPILIPIAYLLMVSAVLAVLCRHFRYTIQVATALVFSCIPIVAWRLEVRSGNLEYLAVGLLGLLLGLLSIERVGGFVKHPIGVAMVYAVYLLVVTYWNNYLTQLLGIAANLMVMYTLGQRSEAKNRVKDHIELLGKYSLFGYIAQIAILQVLRRVLPADSAATPAIAFGLAFALTMASVEALDRLRRRAIFIDRMYKIVFA